VLLLRLLLQYSHGCEIIFHLLKCGQNRLAVVGDSPIITGRGGSLGEAIRSIGVTDQTYYRWRKEYGGLKMEQAKRLKELERENTRLRKAVADLTLDKQILAEVAKGNF
jgi:putative transposase